MKITKGAGIYLLTHIESGQKYVGQSTNIKARLRAHASGFGGGEIGRAVRQYGWASFNAKVLEDCPLEELNAAEQRWITIHDCRIPKGFNTQFGGCRPGLGDGFVGATSKERQARSRKARETNGGKQIAIMLTPKSTEILAEWVSEGHSISSVINRILIESEP